MLRALASMSDFQVDFVAKDPWRMILVEEGPWDDLAFELGRLQERLYSCLDAAIDGQLAQKFPESIGHVVTIELHGYNLPQDEVSNFFSRFGGSVLKLPEYAQALKESAHIVGVSFFATFE